MSEPRILTINHGQCENILVGWVRVRLNMGIESYSRDNGANAIRIENIPDLLKSKWLRSEANLHAKFGNLEYESDKNPKMPRLKIFPIMDTEYDAAHSNRSYMRGNMFDGYWFRDRIMPIYNIPDMDTVFENAGIGKVSADKPSSYSNILDDYEVIDVYEMLKERDDTNLDTFLGYCLSTRPEYQNKGFEIH